MKFICVIILAVLTITVHGQSIKHPVLKGRYIMKGTNCAGFDFIDNKTLVWYSELQCMPLDTLRVKWISNDMFTTRDKAPFYKNCPPRVYIYQVLKIDDKQLVLKSIWTGWNEGKDAIEEFRKH